MIHLYFESNLIVNQKIPIMKTQTAIQKSETFEDLIFEGRNKSYGAFELNRMRVRYMLIAFLVSIAGISTCIAVPFINALKDEGIPAFIKERFIPIDISSINQKNDVPLPPPMKNLEEFEKSMIRNLAPVVVGIVEDEFSLITEDLIDKTINKPVELEHFPVQSSDPAIPETEIDTIILFPSEPARFMGGDLNTFRKWVGENMNYPAEAQKENLFGKVTIEFCVNKKGEVEEIKVLRGLHPVLDDATIRVISSSPRWTPAKQGGTPVKTKYVIPFMFDLI